MTKVILTVFSPGINIFLKMKKSTVLFIVLCLILAAISCAQPPQQALPPPPAPSPSPSPSPTPSEPQPQPEPIQEVSQSEGEIPRRYTWDYESREWTLELEISEALYRYYKEIPRPPTPNYSVYVTHPLDDTYIGYLADEFRSFARQHNWDEQEIVEFAAAFVQSLPYTDDSVTTPYDEYPRYPLETLVDNGGDCEDTSILLASILHSLSYKVVLIAFPDKHCAVGVSVDGVKHGTYFEYNGTKYFYLETTNTGWGIGQIPEEIEGLSAQIYDMTPTPILTHDWEGTISGNVAKIKVTVKNRGTQSADDVYILAGFDAGGGKLWNAEESESFDLAIDQSITVNLTLEAPLGEHTRVYIQIIQGGSAVDESYSEWFDT